MICKKVGQQGSLLLGTPGYPLGGGFSFPQGDQGNPPLAYSIFAFQLCF